MLAGNLPFGKDLLHCMRFSKFRKWVQWRKQCGHKHVEYPAWFFAPQFSPEAKSLLSDLLHPEPSERITVAMAQEHAWVKGVLLSDLELIEDRNRHEQNEKIELEKVEQQKKRENSLDGARANDDDVELNGGGQRSGSSNSNSNAHDNNSHGNVNANTNTNAILATENSSTQQPVTPPRQPGYRVSTLDLEVNTNIAMASSIGAALESVREETRSPRSPERHTAAVLVDPTPNPNELSQHDDNKNNHNSPLLSLTSSTCSNSSSSGASSNSSNSNNSNNSAVSQHPSSSLQQSARQRNTAPNSPHAYCASRTKRDPPVFYSPPLAPQLTPSPDLDDLDDFSLNDGELQPPELCKPAFERQGSWCGPARSRTSSADHSSGSFGVGGGGYNRYGRGGGDGGANPGVPPSFQDLVKRSTRFSTSGALHSLVWLQFA
jgi:hypothetical protein